MRRITRNLLHLLLGHVHRHIIRVQLTVMDYVKGILSGLTAVFFAEVIPTAWSFRGIGSEKAIGVVVLPAEFVASMLSPLFWTLTIIFFACFFAASRLRSKFLRACLFWIPSLFVTGLGLAILLLLTHVFYVFIRTRPG